MSEKSENSNDYRLFTSLLIKWSKSENARNFAWSGEKNPYLIWLSEIILQQTRSEQGLPYYLKFKENYPEIKDLATAPLDKVLRDWQGLGYYSRARNLHQTAKEIFENREGVFPTTYSEIIKLKGVGAYTAAAISSFAFGEAKAVVDGNVIRVLARFFGVYLPFDTSAGKKKFRELAQEVLDKKKPAFYNQAIMDFGASVCMPKPLCNECCFQKKCVAFKHGLINELPVKSKKIILRHRYFYYFIVETKTEIAIRQRTKKDIWQGLWELPMFELDKADLKTIEKQLKQKLNIVFEHTQTLSHQKIHHFFIPLKNTGQHTFIEQNIQFVPKKTLEEFAFPKTVHLFLSQKDLL